MHPSYLLHNLSSSFGESTPNQRRNPPQWNHDTYILYRWMRKCCTTSSDSPMPLGHLPASRVVWQLFRSILVLFPTHKNIIIVNINTWLRFQPPHYFTFYEFTNKNVTIRPDVSFRLSLLFEIAYHIEFIKGKDWKEKSLKNFLESRP